VGRRPVTTTPGAPVWVIVVLTGFVDPGDVLVIQGLLPLAVADVSRPYANRWGAGRGVRVYVKATGLRPEARDFLARAGGG
jgi:hypothetical protein